MTQDQQTPLYQVQVTDNQGKQVCVGPVMCEAEGPGQLADSINKRVAIGREKNWRDARVVSIHSISVH